MNNFHKAAAIVRNPDIRDVKSTLYKNFGSVCRAIILTVNPNDCISQSRSFNNNYPDKELIDGWIKEYVTARTDVNVINDTLHTNEFYEDKCQ